MRSFHRTVTFSLIISAWTHNYVNPVAMCFELLAGKECELQFYSSNVFLCVAVKYLYLLVYSGSPCGVKVMQGNMKSFLWVISHLNLSIIILSRSLNHFSLTIITAQYIPMPYLASSYFNFACLPLYPSFQLATVSWLAKCLPQETVPMEWVDVANILNLFIFFFLLCLDVSDVVHLYFEFLGVVVLDRFSLGTHNSPPPLEQYLCRLYMQPLQQFCASVSAVSRVYSFVLGWAVHKLQGECHGSRLWRLHEQLLQPDRWKPKWMWT